MSVTNTQTDAKTAVQAKFGRKKRIKSRYAPRYPESAEREYRRINKAYVQILNTAVQRQLPAIMSAYKRQMRRDSREDGIFDFLSFLRGKIHEIATAVAKKAEAFGLEKRIGKMAEMIRTRSITEWSNAVKMGFGLDVPAEGYMDGLYEQEVQRWISDNFNYVRSIPVETLLEIENLISDAFRDGVDIDDLEASIEKMLNRALSRGQIAATSQVSSLNAYMMKMHQTQAGVKKYVWISCRDSRVRDCHREFDGKVYSWDAPPEDWYMTVTRGIVYTGHRYNPGEAHGCRCCAAPVFERETFRPPGWADYHSPR